MNNMYKILESFDSLTPQTAVVEAKVVDPELQKIAHTYPREVKLLIQTGDIDNDLYSALFDYYNNSGEMPYGVSKARDGDPYEWIFQRFSNDMGLDSPLSNVGQDAGLGLDKAMQDVEEEIRTYGGMGGAGSMGGMTESSADFYRKLSDLVEGKKSKPDFLDLDKDGNKTEPMKKAAKEKQVDEAAKPDFLDLDKDGNKKEPMKKAAKEVKEAAADEPADPDSDAVAKRKARDAARRRREEKAEADKDDLSKDYRPSSGKSASSKFVAGRAYGGAAQKDEPEDDDNDSKTSAGAAKKRGRPAGTKRAIGAKGPTGKSKLMKKGAIKEQGVEDMEEGWRGGMLGEPPIVKTREKYAGSEHQAALQELYDLVTSPWIKNSVDAGIRKHLVRLVKTLKTTEGAGSPVAEKAPPGAKAERMVKGIKKSLSKDGHLSDKDKAIAYATTWKAHKQGKVEEEAGVEEGSTGDYSAKKARAGKDIGKPGKGFAKIAKSAGEKYGSKAAGERVAGAVLAKLRGKNESKEEVEETTCAGSVAPSVAAPKKASAGGYQFGKGVYESINNQVEKMITEGMSINVNVDTNGQKSINVSATEEDADKLAEILKMAGIGGQVAAQEEPCCEACGTNPCECSMVEESNELANGADDTEYADTDMLTNKLAGGLNKPKTTVAGDGQTTIPVTAVQVKESQEVSKIENSLWSLFKSFKK